jgi:hypothetical protein
MILRFLLVVFFAFPLFAQCALTQFVVEPQTAYYGEDVDVRVRFACPHGSGPHSPRVLFLGSTIVLEFQPEVGGPTVPSEHADRIFLGRIAPGTYNVIVRERGRATAGERTLVVRERPFMLAPHIGGEGTEVAIGLFANEVRFGSAPATIRYVDESTVAVAPPHAPGLVDVTVTTDSGSITYDNAFRYGPVSEEDFARVLFPVTLTGAGAHGSEWHSDVIVHNGGPVPVETVPQIYVDPGSPILPIALASIPSGANARFPETTRDGGAFLYIPRGTGGFLSYSSHIVDRSRSATDLGSEIPVVRSEDTASSITLPQVRIGEGFRARLRIYDFDSVDARFVTIIVRGEDGSTHQFRATVRAEGFACPTTPCLRPTPGFANVDLSAFESLRNVRVADVHIRAQRDARLWAFVSVTNNETQRVTIYTPQKERP